jgi:drug/metabolite transporter (DMT)-like permease
LAAAAIPLALKFVWSWPAIGWMVAFNVAVGFVGYALRYYAVPIVSTEVFGLLSFVGVLSAFLFGYLFAGERPSLWTLVGAALIVYAVANVETIKKGAT